MDKIPVVYSFQKKNISKCKDIAKEVTKIRSEKTKTKQYKSSVL